MRAKWCAAIVVLLAVAVAIRPQPAAAQRDNSVTARQATATYDIPAQDLDAALSIYFKVSGAQVVYETTLTAGRRSTPVKGQLTPAAALRILLAGTGLAARRLDDDAFGITAAGTQEADAPAAALSRAGNFVTVLQRGVLKALCSDQQTRPGGYRIALELWIGPSGRIQSSALVGSTGDAARDTALIAVLQNVALGSAPPAGTPQPIILTIAPRQPRETGDCAG